MRVDITINDTFTEEEVYAIISGLKLFMYDNKYLNENGFNAANSALEKILKEVE